MRRPPDRRRGPEVITPQGRAHVELAPTGPSVQRGPVVLGEAIAELLAWSDALDASLRLRLAAYRDGYAHGYERGVDDGRRQAEAEQERAWYAATHPIAIGGIPYDELERRRYGPGGRKRAGDPRPGDYPGNGAA